MIPSEKLFPNLGCVVTGTQGQDIFKFSRNEVRELLKAHNVILFRGFDIGLEEFKKFSDQCCTQFMSHSYVLARNKFAEFGADTTITEVTIGQNDLALHGEMYHSPDHPEVIWFYCQTPAAIGGATTLADASALLAQLPPTLQKLFATKKIRYKHHDPIEAWGPRYGTDSIQDVMAMLKTRDGVMNVSTDDKKTLIYDYVSSAVRRAKYQDVSVFMGNLFINKNPANRPDFNLKNYHNLPTAPAPTATEKKRAISVEFEDGTQISDEILQEIFEASSRITLDCNWRPKDLLMVDNTRVLHGRRAFEGKRVIATRVAAAA